MPDQILKDLRAAVKGLLYPSEYDSPFEVTFLEGSENSATEVGRQLGSNSKRQTQTVAEFFDPVASIEGFSALRQTLENQLTGVRVYRFGTTGDIIVALVGATKDGRLVCLKTVSVET
jgi:hypothetical protein